MKRLKLLKQLTQRYTTTLKCICVVTPPQNSTNLKDRVLVGHSICLYIFLRFLCSALMNKKAISILIVDDNVGFIKRMKSLLAETGNIGNIDIANSCDEASPLLVKDHDFVLLDIRMPGKSGISLLKEIRETEKDCEVIMISNHTDEFYREQCKELGANFFLDKTNDFEKVAHIVKASSN